MVSNKSVSQIVYFGSGNSGGLSLVEITNSAGNTTYCSQADPSSAAVALTSCGIPVTTTSTSFKIRVTPKSHINMLAPPGSTYSVTGTVTSFTSTNSQSGTDTDSATVTIDNASPANITAASGSPGDTQVSLSWTNPVDSDFHSAIVLRRSGTATSDTPTEGTTYIVDNTIGASMVACIVTSPTAGCTDTGLTNGTVYHYRIYTKDSNGNYSDTGVVPTGSPFTPAPSADTTAPAAVSNLATGAATTSSIVVTWTAPGDDNNTGTATTYDLRYSTSLITSGNFDSATAVTGEPTPSVAGSSETKTVTGLSASTTYYFALKTADEVPNTSTISNVPSGTTSATPDTTAPNMTGFSIPGTSTSLEVPITTFTATDNIVVTGYLLTETADAPSASDFAWSISAPTSYIFSSQGFQVLYAWAKDAAGNISGSLSDSVVITLPAVSGSEGGARAPGAGGVLPTILRVSGKAYPGGKAIWVTKGINGVISDNAVTILPSGDFGFILAKIIQGNYTYGLLVEDKDGRKSQAKVYNVDFISAGSFTREILVSPTVSVDKELIRKGDILKVSGYAYPKLKVVLNLGGIDYETFTKDDGTYEFSVSTGLLSIGNNFLRVKQIDAKADVESEWSPTKNLNVSLSVAAAVDLNGDGIIDISDWSVFLVRFKSKDSQLVSSVDFNRDKKTDVADFSIFLKSFKMKR